MIEVDRVLVYNLAVLGFHVSNPIRIGIMLLLFFVVLSVLLVVRSHRPKFGVSGSVNHHHHVVFTAGHLVPVSGYSVMTLYSNYATIIFCSFICPPGC